MISQRRNGRVEPGPGPNSTAGPQDYNEALGGGPYEGFGTEWIIPNAASVVQSPTVYRMRQ